MLHTGCEFDRPYASEIFGETRRVFYIYPREALMEEPIFPYFVLDGGAHNFAKDILGTANGDDIRELTMSGRLFDAFTFRGKFSLESSFAYTAGTGFTPKYEWQIWPQRLYMTLPLAQAFLKTGDRTYADKWLELVRAWDAAHPYQPFADDVDYLKTDMVWRDMQAAWRSLSLMHGMFMLQEAPFDRETWEYLYSFVELHVRHLYEEAQNRLRRGLEGNHVLQIGLALVMAGALFPEFQSSADYLRAGCETVEMNMNAIYPDGASNEDSPSYSHFIARLYLETLLLLKRNDLPLIPGLEECVKNQYAWLWQMCTPDGHAPTISDSYTLDAEADLRRAAALIDFPRPARTSQMGPESHTAVLRKGCLTLYADAMEYLDGHQHAGRPQILLYADKLPVIVDSGCCSYDIWDFYRYLRSAQAHNLLFSPDCPVEGGSIQQEMTDFDPVQGTLTLRSRVSNGDRSYTWTRRLLLTDNRLTIEDSAESDRPLTWQLHTHLCRRDLKELPEENALLQLSEDLLIRIAADRPFALDFVPVMNERNEKDFARRMRFQDSGKTFALTTTIDVTRR